VLMLVDWLQFFDQKYWHWWKVMHCCTYRTNCAISLLFVKRTATVSNSPVIKLFIPSQSHLNHNGESQILLQGKSHKNSFEEAHLKRCGCGCGRKLVGRKKYYDSSCRKRAQCVRDKRTASNAT